MEITKYRVRGFSGADADFDFECLAEKDTLHGDKLRAAIMAHAAIGSMWHKAIKRVEDSLNEEHERADERDVDSQRVYLFSDKRWTYTKHDSCFFVVFEVLVDIVE